jgi:hypothetical protein
LQYIFVSSRLVDSTSTAPSGLRFSWLESPANGVPDVLAAHAPLSLLDR